MLLNTESEILALLAMTPHVHLAVQAAQSITWHGERKQVPKPRQTAQARYGAPADAQARHRIWNVRAVPTVGGYALCFLCAGAVSGIGAEQPRNGAPLQIAHIDRLQCDRREAVDQHRGRMQRGLEHKLWLDWRGGSDPRDRPILLTVRLRQTVS